MKAKWETAQEVEFLAIKDLYTALGMAKDLKEEKTIRIWIWWAFNDRVREGGVEIFVEEGDENLWKGNCRTLLNILNKDDLNENLMIAELSRNLGMFEDCIEIIDHIDNKP
jgi:hypothetical protein